MGMPELFMLLVVVSLLSIVLSVLWFRFRQRQLQHQERMAALEKGVTLIPAVGAQAPWSARVYLLRGLIWTFTGATLSIALLGIGFTASRAPSAEVQAMRARDISNYLAIPIDQARTIVAKDLAAHAGQNEGMPIALALFGLIPLGVGLAYLIYYRSEKSAPSEAEHSLSQ